MMKDVLKFELVHVGAIVLRFHEVHMATKLAKFALHDVLTTPEDLLSVEDKEIVRDAMRVLERLHDASHHTKALKYFNDIIAGGETA